MSDKRPETKCIVHATPIIPAFSKWDGLGKLLDEIIKCVVRIRSHKRCPNNPAEAKHSISASRSAIQL